MKYCNNCGAIMEDSIEYCPNCGAASNTEQPTQNYQSYDNLYNNAPLPNQYCSNAVNAKKKMSTPAKVALIVTPILIVVILCTTIFTMLIKFSKTYTPEPFTAGTYSEGVYKNEQFSIVANLLMTWDAKTAQETAEISKAEINPTYGVPEIKTTLGNTSVSTYFDFLAYEAESGSSIQITMTEIPRSLQLKAQTKTNEVVENYNEGIISSLKTNEQIKIKDTEPTVGSTILGERRVKYTAMECTIGGIEATYIIASYCEKGYIVSVNEVVTEFSSNDAVEVLHMFG